MVQQNLFGTDGIRAHVGDEPFTASSIFNIGNALGQWIGKKYGENANILLAHDTRISCAFMKSALKTGLLQYPINLYDANILPTPAVFQLLHYQSKFDGGIIISASHNPYQDNGIKLVDGKKGKLTHHDELEISSIFYQKNIHPEPQKFGTDHYWKQSSTYYESHILTHFSSPFLKGIKVVLDCANGATSHIGPRLFKKLGAEVIPIHYQPNGLNINEQCGSLHIESLQQTVIKEKAHIGFAFDGDGDRIMVISRTGEVKDGDDIIALLLEHELYKNSAIIVGTIISNQGLALHLKEQHKTFLRTPVGDKYVAAELIKNKSLLGGEQSGHIITRDYLNTGDGLFIALRILETIINNNNWDLKTFKKFPQAQINLPIKNKKDLHIPPLAQIIEEEEQNLLDGRLVVRYSGTENILRIMVEEQNLELANRIGQQLAQRLKKELT